MRNGAMLMCVLGAVLGSACDVEDVSQDPDEELVEGTLAATSASAKRGKRLFKNETFDGNDRTCSSCHRGVTGTISPSVVEELHEDDPTDPLFRGIDSDDGLGETYTRLIEDATVRVVIPLPPHIRPLDDLDATHVVLNRGVPTMNNTALDAVLMYDGRAPDLETQALGAVHDHAENEREPTEQELSDIAEYQRTLFSNPQLAAYAAGGPPPELPRGRTPSQKRGRAFFEPDGACGVCHSGPMLNQTSEFHPFLPAGLHFEDAFAGRMDFVPNPLREWAVVDPETHEVLEVLPFAFPDPGRMAITGDPADAALFKITTLWGASRTAPYFHDNSVKDLDELMVHYTRFLDGIFNLTPQDEKDIIAYLKLL